MKEKIKVTVSLDKTRLEELDLVVAARDSNRSALIGEALEVWYREQIRQELARGYREMAEEDRKTAERNLRSGVETLERGT